MMKEAEGKGEVPVLVTREDRTRLEALKRTQFDPFWLVIHRLLDSYDLSRSKTAPQTAPEGSPA